MKYRKRLLGCVMAAGMCIGNTMSGMNLAYAGTDGDNTIGFSGTVLNGQVESNENDELVLTLGVLMSGMGGMSQGGQGGEAPQMPSGGQDGEAPQMPSGESQDGGAPEKPSGESQDGEAPQMPSGGQDGGAPEMPSGGEIFTAGNTKAVLTVGDESVIKDQDGNSIGLSDIETGDIISITVDEEGIISEIALLDAQVQGAFGAPGGMGGGAAVTEYDAETEFTDDAEVSDTDFACDSADTNVIHVLNGADVTIKNTKITSSSKESSGGDNASFYGVGAALLTTDGNVYLQNADIKTDGNGEAGVFAYGDGTAYVADSTIDTDGNTAGGIHVAGGGTLYAWNTQAETDGESSAAIRSDRGGGKMVVDGGTYTSNGTGSPAVYCTADIAINNAALTATGSEAVCIEGLNTLKLYDCTLEGNMSDDDRNECTWNVIVYQSMSGDSEIGNGTFQMVGGTIKAGNGGQFYTTNTESTITLNSVDITPAEENDYFLKCTGNANQRGWGQSGNNGADCTFTGISQKMEGDVIWDSISSLDFYMTQGSTLEGAVIDDEANAGNGGEGSCNLYIDSDSVWTVTGDSTLTGLYCEGKIVDEDGNSVTIAGKDGTVYAEGTSQYTVTVEEYSDKADLSNASQCDEWSDHAAERPEQLAEK